MHSGAWPVNLDRPEKNQSALECAFAGQRQCHCDNIALHSLNEKLFFIGIIIKLNVTSNKIGWDDFCADHFSCHYQASIPQDLARCTMKQPPDLKHFRYYNTSLNTQQSSTATTTPPALSVWWRQDPTRRVVMNLIGDWPRLPSWFPPMRRSV